MNHIYLLMLGAAMAAAPSATAQTVEPATFDDVEIIDESGVRKPTAETDSYRSGSFAFNGTVAYYGEFEVWSGYAVSSIADNVYSSLDDQFKSAPGGGYKGSQFGVAFPEANAVDVVTDDEEGAVISGMYITNSAYAYTSMTQGDAFSKKFEQGDWFKLTITGHHADGTTSTLDYYLADMRDEDPANHRVNGDWEWLALDGLGKVKSLTFAFDSTDKANGYLNTPQYFCLDNLGGEPENNRIDTVGGMDASAPAEYFTIQGVRVDAPSVPGFYVERRGAKARTILVR